MNRIWLVIAGCGAIVAGVLIFLGKFDAAFVAGTLGVLAWFVDVRVQLKSVRAEKEIDDLGKQDED